VTSLAPGAQVPDFTLKNTSGGPVRLSEYQKGGPLVLAFFKHECPTCQLAMPFIDRLHRKSRDGKVRFLGVAQDAKEDAVAFAKQYALMMPFVLEDAPYATSTSYALTHVPTVLLLDAGRNVQFVQVGFSKKACQELADRLAGLSGKEPEILFDTLSSVPELKPG
jgi:peroxiredoxin